MAKSIKTLLEGELEKAQVALAARDMVDQLQGTIEDLTKLKVEELEALKESIRANMTPEEADQFVNSVAPALQSAIDAVTQAKDQVDQAALAISGEAPSGMLPSPDIGLPGDDLAPEDGMDDMAPATDTAAGGEEPLGRARRESRYNKMKAMVESLERKVQLARKKSKK